MSIFIGSCDSYGKNPQQIQHAMLQQNAPRHETPGSPSRPLGLPHPSWQRVLVSSLPCASPYRMPRPWNPHCAVTAALAGATALPLTRHLQVQDGIFASRLARPSHLWWPGRKKRVMLCSAASTRSQDHQRPITRASQVNSRRNYTGRFEALRVSLRTTPTSQAFQHSVQKCSTRSAQG